MCCDVGLKVVLRPGWMGLSVYGLCCSVAAVGCDGPPPASPEEPAQQAHEARAPGLKASPSPGAAESTGPAPAPNTAAARFEVALDRVERRGDTVEIEVVMSRPLPPMSGSRPTLQVGDEVARHSRAGADGRLDRLVFTVEAAQFDRMPTDLPIVVRVGPLSNAGSEIRPRLADVAITAQGDSQ